MFESERDERLVLSTRHIKLRTVLFVLAFLLAIFSFTYGIRQMTHKDPGLYEVDTNPDAENTLYNFGFHLFYYFDGSSNEIKQAQNQLRDFYSISLGRVVKELDPVREYDSLVSLAALNAHPGEAIEVSEELMDVLQDAYARQSDVYSLFNGPLYGLWQDILSLSEPQDSDPVNDPNVRERVEIFSALEPETFGELRFSGNTVTYLPGEGYLDLITENEYPEQFIDLNLLHDAYVLRLVARDLIANGWTKGFLQSDSGTLVLLGDMEIEGLNLCGIDTENAVLKNVAVYAPSPGAAMSRFTILGGEEAAYYTIEDEGKIHYRHPYYLDSGVPQERLGISYVIDEGGDPVDAVNANLLLQKNILPKDKEFFYSLLGEENIYYSDLADRLAVSDANAQIREPAQ